MLAILDGFVAAVGGWVDLVVAVVIKNSGNCLYGCCGVDSLLDVAYGNTLAIVVVVGAAAARHE